MVVVMAVALAATPATAQAIDWKSVETAIGRAGVTQAGDVHRFNFPRSDLHVTVDGVALKPALALGGWIAMKAAPGGVMAMGDLVLAENEATAVITKLQSGGVEQTAIHHHLLREAPRVVYVHVHAHGDAVAIGRTIRQAMALTKAPSPASPGASAGGFGLDTVALVTALGYSGRTNGGVYQVSVPRIEQIREGSFEIPPSMGLATGINFQPTGNGNAAITGDFVMIGSEVNAVIKALRDGGIEVTALHNHMLGEEPRLFFMHFWANGDAVKLSHALRGALAKTNSKRPSP